MLKIMTLNLNYYGGQYGPWDARRDLIFLAIREERPDILAFQAVRKDPTISNGLDQAAQIAGILPEYSHSYFEPAMKGDSGSEEGSALLARLPWIDTGCQELTLLPGLEDKNKRLMLAARFDGQGGPLTLLNAHFSWVSEQARVNIEEALRFAGSFQGRRILVGDLNTTPESDLWQPLIEAGWKDAWAQLQPQDPGYTFVEDGRLAKRIDYAWVSPELIGQIKQIRVVAGEVNESGVRVSDHAGLLVTLT